MTKWLITTVTALTLISSPVFAQSYDPDIGSGNLVPRVEYRGDTPVQVLPGHRLKASTLRATPDWQASYASARPAAGSVQAEQNWFSEAEGNID